MRQARLVKLSLARTPDARLLFALPAARDFADIYVLAHRFGKDVLIARAAQVDACFSASALADMVATLDRFTDDRPGPLRWSG